MTEVLEVLFRDCILPSYEVQEIEASLAIESQKRLQGKQRVLAQKSSEMEYAQEQRIRYQDTLCSYETWGSLLTASTSLALGLGALATGATPTWVAYSAITGGALSLTQEAAKVTGLWKKVASFFYEDVGKQESFALKVNQALTFSAMILSSASSAFLLRFQVDLALNAFTATKYLMEAGKIGLFSMQMYNGHYLEKTKASLTRIQLETKQVEEQVSEATSSTENYLKNQQKHTEIYHQLTEKAIYARQIASSAA